MKSTLWSLIFVASLTYSTYAATTPRTTAKAGATPKVSPPTKGAPKRSQLDHGIQSRIGADNSTIGSGRVITTRFGSDGVTPQQQCRCVLFYLCDQNEVLDVPTNGEQCAAQLEVCCLLPLNSLNDTSLPIAPIPTSSPAESGSSSSGSTIRPTSNPSPIITETESSSSTTADPNGCQCVPLIRCLNNTDPITGAGNIDVRIPTCSSEEICCNLVDIVSSSDSPSTSSSTSESSTFPQPTSETPTSSESATSAPLPTPVAEQCGVRNSGVNNRITISGSGQSSRETIFGEFPWMAIILTSEDSDGERIDNLFVCGASIVAPNIILTAAHCVYQRDSSLLKIRAGEYDTRSGSRVEPLPHQDIRVSHVYIHPKYNPKVLYNDIALITTEQPFNVSQNVGSICIPLINSDFAANTAYDSRQCLATGWGKDAFGADARYQTTLKKVDLSLVSHDQCQKRLRGTRLGPYYILDQSFLCAGGEEGADTCEGDGGGPLICALKSDPNRYVQVGIVSWGIGCGTNVPAVYASLHSNINWLTEQYTVLATFQEQSFRSSFPKRN